MHRRLQICSILTCSAARIVCSVCAVCACVCGVWYQCSGDQVRTVSGKKHTLVACARSTKLGNCSSFLLMKPGTRRGFMHRHLQTCWIQTCSTARIVCSVCCFLQELCAVCVSYDWGHVVVTRCIQLLKIQAKVVVDSVSGKLSEVRPVLTYLIGSGRCRGFLQCIHVHLLNLPCHQRQPGAPGGDLGLNADSNMTYLCFASVCV